PVLLEIVYVKLSVANGLAVTGGVYLNVPSAAITTLFVPFADENVPATAATPPIGRSFAMIVPVSGTNGVVGDPVAPPVTTASVLFTRLLYESLFAPG